MKFTRDTVAALTMPAGKLDHIVWDPELPGFGVRLRPASRTWVCQYRVGRQTRREKLGDTRKVRLDDARGIARKRFAQVELGIDPKTTKVTADVATRGLTLAATVVRHLEFKRPGLRPSSYEAKERYLTKHWAPLAARPLASIGRADVAARLQELAKECGPVAAKQAKSHLTTLLSWAAKEGLVETNVAVHTNDPAAGRVPRERVLNADEIRMIWNACDDVGDFGAITKLLLLTGQRRNEIAHLHWPEIDPGVTTITLPRERVKNKRAHVVPLSPAASSILKARPHHYDLVFGNGKPFTSWSNGKRALDRKIAETGKALVPWSLHDCRRTAASGMQQLGVRVEVIERALNHVSGSYRGVVGIYQRDPMTEDVRDALARWARHVLAVVAGRKLKLVPKHNA
jgi:integrase